jgi:hypothetical protein
MTDSLSTSAGLTKAVAEFPPELRQFQRQKKLNVDKRLFGYMDRFLSLRELDEDVDLMMAKVEKIRKPFLVISGILLFLMLFILPPLFLEGLPAAGWTYLLLFAGCVTASIVCTVKLHRLGAYDLPDRYGNAVLPLLYMMHEELGDAPGSSLSLDLSGYRTAAKRVGSKSYLTGEENLYIDPWFRLDGMLAGGGSLRLTMLDRVRVRSWTKRSSSGKTKSKEKVKSFLVIRTRLSFPADRMAAVAPAQSSLVWRKVTTRVTNGTATVSVVDKLPLVKDLNFCGAAAAALKTAFDLFVQTGAAA